MHFHLRINLHNLCKDSTLEFIEEQKLFFGSLKTTTFFTEY